MKLSTLVTRARRIQVNGSSVRVNLGSGLEVAPGWIHLDIGMAALAARWPRPLQKLIYRSLPSSSAAKRDLSEDEFCTRISSHRFHHCRLQDGLPFHDDTVDYLFSSHVLEHLYLSEARRLLAECHRVLKPGGVLRLCVPDLDHEVEQTLFVEDAKPDVGRGRA